jgi:hypothetical protein
MEPPTPAFSGLRSTVHRSGLDRRQDGREGLLVIGEKHFGVVTPLGSSFNDLQGRVLHVVASNYYVAVFIHVVGGWWTKPYWDSPATIINCDGAWTCDITTGGSDEQADLIVACVLRMSYSVPLLYGDTSLPPDIAANAVANVSVSR